VLVADALAFIEQNCHRALEVSEIAQELGVGERRLRRRFRAVRDRTIRQEIALVRLGRARDLLATTGFSAEAIARAVGLGSGRALRRMLRRREGATPSAYRRERERRPRRDVYPMEQAKGLLERTDYPLDLIYMLCGFPSRGIFKRAFRQQEGMTPGAYRAMRAAERPVPKPPEITITLDLDGVEEEAKE